MKKSIPLFFVLAAAGLTLQGCSVMESVNAYNNARSGYEAYQGMKGMKGLEEAKPVMKNSDTLFVVADLKSTDGVSKDIAEQNRKSAERICMAFDREFASMMTHDLNRGRTLRCLSGGEVPADAVVLNLREQVETGGMMRMLQSDTIKSETSWVSRSTGAILDSQANPGFKRTDEVVEHVSNTLSMQILRSLSPEKNDPEYKAWTDKVTEWSKARSKS